MFLLWYYVLALLVAGGGVMCSVPIVDTIALKYQKLDLPSARKVHQRPIARLGGIAICLSTAIALGIVWISGLNAMVPQAGSKIGWVLIGSFVFFLIGLADDLMGLSPLFRLLLQFGVSSWIWNVGVRIDFISVPGFGIFQLSWLSLPITVVWLTGVVNAINWIDGLDGLASGVTCIAALVLFTVCLFIHQFVAAALMIALAGSLIGFLYYNFNPARIFMGDSGSYFLGFTIAGISIVSLTKSAAVTAVLVPLVVLAVPLLDMVAVIVARLRSGQSPFTADTRHLHHRLLKLGLSHRFTVILMYALALWVGTIAIAIAGIPNGFVILIGATGFLGATSWHAWRSVRQC